jgi:hypothetical protein
MRTSYRFSFMLLVLAGCSGMSPTQVGHAAGGIAGSFIVPGLGSTVGSLVGALAGMVVEGRMDQAREQHERADLGRELATAPVAPGNTTGALAAAGTPTRVWVDEQVHDGRLFAGHFEVRPVP